jgi:hypothetical protein
LLLRLQFGYGGALLVPVGRWPVVCEPARLPAQPHAHSAEGVAALKRCSAAKALSYSSPLLLLLLLLLRLLLLLLRRLLLLLLLVV